MKRGIITLTLVTILVMNFSIMAFTCDLETLLLNQDPYPAVPGDYVELVFQVTGVENPECGTIKFTLQDKYPVEFDPGKESTITVSGGTFTKDFSSFLMVPYKVRVDADALDGDNPIEVSFLSSKTGLPPFSGESKQFNLNVENVKADFEIYVEDFDVSTNTLTLEVLNIAKSNVEALTLEIPKQDNIIVKGSNRNILGDLDSNEYTTADFEAKPSNGQIKVKIIYTDTNGVRRNLEKEVFFDKEYFSERKSQENGSSKGTYVIIVIVLVIVGWWIWRKKKRAKERLKNKKTNF